jgi:crooked neck
MLDPVRRHNQSVSSIQITAEQLILESVSRTKDRPRLPELEHQTQAELEDLRFKRRQAWEKNVTRNLCTFNTFIRYARWEEDIQELDKARSVYERALEFTRFQERQVWICYIDMEIRHRQFNYAFNILERAVTILPRCDEFWLKYAALTESLGNVEGAREIFQRWIAWEPGADAFLSFVEFEARLGEFRRARSVFERLLMVHPFENSFLRYADFEIKLRQPGRARRVFERALDAVGVLELLILRFAQFEEHEAEIERARSLYRLALNKLGESTARELLSSYHQFEKRFGGEAEIESAIIEKKKTE